MMPVCTVFLLSLDCSIPEFLHTLKSITLKPLTVARVVRWIVQPTRLSKNDLLNVSSAWDLLLILPDALRSLPNPLESLVRRAWMIQSGIPSKILQSYGDNNNDLLMPRASQIPPSTSSTANLRKAESTQDLELTDELNEYIQLDQCPSGAVSMLNLLAFRPGRREQYMKYGKAFSDSAGSRRGGVAKLVGKIVPSSCSDGCNEWDEVSTDLDSESRIML